MVYYRKVSTTDPIFQGRLTRIFSTNLTQTISVPDDIVLCNGCNRNLVPDDGYLIYLSKNDLKRGHHYDVYCVECRDRYFPKAQQEDG